MKYRVTHRTHFRYQAPVTESFNEARLQPVSNQQQHCYSFVLRVFPTTRLSHHLDSYSNHVHFFEVPEAHEELLVEGHSIVEIFPQTALAPLVPVAFAQLEPYSHQELCYDFLHTSQYVSTEPYVRDTARAICGEPVDVWSAAMDLMRFIYQNFTYAPQTTSVNTHMEEVLRLRKGVCQDFAHVMIGLCRSIGIPARYVSGYIFNGVSSSEMRGAQASHAWCEILVPGMGWRGLDPTNNLMAGVGHIKVAVGRDYADVAPLRGTYKGANQKQMDVAVSVTETI